MQRRISGTTKCKTTEWLLAKKEDVAADEPSA
jgi:hypothetical protein